MKNRLIFLLIILVVFSSLIGCDGRSKHKPTTSSNVPTQIDTTLMFSEDFETNSWETTIKEYYNLGTTSWEIQNSCLSQTRPLLNAKLVQSNIMFGNIDWENYSFTASVKTSEDGELSKPYRYGIAGIIFRCQNAKTNYQLLLGPTGYVTLHKYNGSEKRILKDFILNNYQIGSFVKLTIQVRNNNIECYANDNLIFTYIDNNSPINSGKIGLFCEGKAEFDNLLAKSL